jgi:hypothetical protein
MAATGCRNAALALSVVTLVGMAVACAGGLLVDDVYGEPGSTAAMLRGYDAVSLVVAVPLLGWALIAVRSGSRRGELVWVGMLAYAVYGYALYVFATGFTDLFLVHVLVLSSAVFALPLALGAVGPAPAARARAVAVVLGALGVSLGAMWVVAALRFAVSGTVPDGSALVETDQVVHLGIALDLVLLVPAYLLAAVLLWRRSGWGAVAAATVLVSGTVHQAGYLVALPFQAAADVPGAQSFDAAEPVIALAFLACALVVLRKA